MTAWYSRARSSFSKSISLARVISGLPSFPVLVGWGAVELGDINVFSWIRAVSLGTNSRVIGDEYEGPNDGRRLLAQEHASGRRPDAQAFEQFRKIKFAASIRAPKRSPAAGPGLHSGSNPNCDCAARREQPQAVR